MSTHILQKRVIEQALSSRPPKGCRKSIFWYDISIKWAYSSVVERVTDNDEVLSSILSTPTNRLPALRKTADIGSFS